ncbi:hypothetical protein [Listeria riparia]|uniref:Secreted protein n=1 Tax=Listeria riparia FSL S10-1204 TaxID=1265816 RepID=W7D730_9LIST|nr:hypothetical protein [Listeria riparia]EUJ44865.1 hypothetical protein PRIP_08512 [Listeria riparia FSL S10-1204]
MNKKTEKLVIPIVTVSLVVASLAPAIDVHAEEINKDDAVVSATNRGDLLSSDIGQDELTPEEMDEFDKYIVVIDNQYVISEEGKEELTVDQQNVVQKYLVASNKSVKENGLIINPNTKIAGQLLGGKGRNGVEMHWNYAKILLNVENTRMVAIGSISVAAGVISLATDAIVAGLFVPAAASILGYKASGIKNGTWWDVNLFTSHISKWGWQ